MHGRQMMVRGRMYTRGMCCGNVDFGKWRFRSLNRLSHSTIERDTSRAYDSTQPLLACQRSSPLARTRRRSYNQHHQALRPSLAGFPGRAMQVRPPLGGDRYVPPTAPHIPSSAIQSLIPRLTTTINDIDAFKNLLGQGAANGSMPNWYASCLRPGDSL